MNSNFARTLSTLRKEKKLSQKAAAAELKVSQALLSHYEKGVREPGLKFVVAAADFYGVSADFLLGRTMSRDGTAINVGELYDDTLSRTNIQRGGAVSLLSKKVLVNSIGILFDLVGKAGDSAMAQSAYDALAAQVYALFRAMYERGGAPSGFFALDADEQKDAVASRAQLSRLLYERSLTLREDELPEISNDMLARDYPLLYQSLLTLIHNVERDTQRLLGSLEADE